MEPQYLLVIVYTNIKTKGMERINVYITKQRKVTDVRYVERRKANNTMEPYEIAEEKIHEYEDELEKREYTHTEYKKRVKEFDICLMAAVCPICGKNLYLDRRKRKNIFVRLTQYKHGKVRCPSGCKFVHPEVGNVSSPKSIKYMNCINYDIHRAHHKLASYNIYENKLGE